MEFVHTEQNTLTPLSCDCFGRCKPSELLRFAQAAAEAHCRELGADWETMAAKNYFWAVIRQKMEITRLPQAGETITVKTWPMPTTKVAYPRSIVAYDEQGHEVFRAISIWVLMNLDTRSMILPGKSGIEVSGTIRGTELSVPRSLLPVVMKNHDSRTVRYTDLDRNGHLNNTRYLDWLDDLISSDYHCAHPVKEFTICYHSEAREGQELDLSWELLEGGVLQVDAHREKTDVPGKQERVFTAQMLF